MSSGKSANIAVISYLFIASLTLASCGLFETPIDYNTQIKPILNTKCITCHGGVKESSGFSLFSEHTAFRKNESGKPAIIRGDANSSELIRRLQINDPDERMPFGEPPLAADEIKLIKKWIDQGAEWGLHWSYEPIIKENDQFKLGSVNGSESGENVSSQIDDFVKEKQREIGLKANPRASKSELLRRLSFDLIGMPAPINLQQSFLSDQINYEMLVDALLASKSYGEKWTSMWLDIARYADTKGFEKDGSRTIWPYRDYVIKSFNDDKPYNTFVLEQLAGDMLEQPTEEQYIATGFHRNTATNDEGGTDNEEYRIKAVIDRLNTTYEGLMGTTMACTQCHGHPYDPFPHSDFYTSFAFFNNTRDADTALDYPRLQFLDSINQTKLDELTSWISSVATKEESKKYELFVKTRQPVIYSVETDQMINADLYDTKYLGLRNNGSARIPNVELSAKKRMVIKGQTSTTTGTISLRLDSLNGQEIANQVLENTKWKYQLLEIKLDAVPGKHDLYIYYTNPQLKGSDSRGMQIDWMFMDSDFPAEGTQESIDRKKKFEELVLSNNDNTLIMVENPPEMRRSTHVYDRGNWQVLMQEVTANVPGILPPLEIEGSANRLDFAKWVVDEKNPLTARTYVNRIWEQLFGRGIVRTVEDLGSQGDPPSHFDLINYLAYTFMYKDNWSTKSLIKSIVLSETYQSSALKNKTLLSKDPYNIYLSAGPRKRLAAEQIRDQALYLSGTLSSKMYGEPVMPYQPENVWQSPYSGEKWEISSGEDQYRRALYTKIKRTSIYPSLETFDMAQRQVCNSRRINTNTPLQALVTLNDPVYTEASDYLARRMVNEGGNDLEGQFNYAYQLGMSKPISNEKLEILINLYEATLKDLSGENIDNSEAKFIARSTVANAIINLDEMLNY